MFIYCDVYMCWGIKCSWSKETPLFKKIKVCIYWNSKFYTWELLEFSTTTEHLLTWPVQWHTLLELSWRLRRWSVQPDLREVAWLHSGLLQVKTKISSKKPQWFKWLYFPDIYDQNGMDQIWPVCTLLRLDSILCHLTSDGSTFAHSVKNQLHIQKQDATGICALSF